MVDIKRVIEMDDKNILFKSEPTSIFCDYIGERSKAFRKAWWNMKNDEIIQYYDYLMRLAVSKCNSRADAEDLVGDTMLAAFACIHNGGKIDYPKTWLSNTFYHKRRPGSAV